MRLARLATDAAILRLAGSVHDETIPIDVFWQSGNSRPWQAPPTSGNPLGWLLLLLAASVGLPFFVLSTTAPLLQKWYSNTGKPAGDDPYFLYAASNLGSLLALLGYPFLIEPFLPVHGMTTLLSGGPFESAIGRTLGSSSSDMAVPAAPSWRSLLHDLTSGRLACTSPSSEVTMRTMPKNVFERRPCP
jgi:hypothetical protein